MVKLNRAMVTVRYLKKSFKFSQNFLQRQQKERQVNEAIAKHLPKTFEAGKFTLEAAH